MKATFESIDEYITTYSDDVKIVLEQVRQCIKMAAPEAEETISYQMPAFKYYGMLVYFAAYKNHIGFYPTPSGIRTFQEEISIYKNSKGAVQFPLNQTIPVDLITKIVKFRVSENINKVKLKSKK